MGVKTNNHKRDVAAVVGAALAILLAIGGTAYELDHRHHPMPTPAVAIAPAPAPVTTPVEVVKKDFDAVAPQPVAPSAPERHHFHRHHVSRGQNVNHQEGSYAGVCHSPSFVPVNSERVTLCD